jgi:hypothetical protein
MFLSRRFVWFWLCWIVVNSIMGALFLLLARSNYLLIGAFVYGVYPFTFGVLQGWVVRRADLPIRFWAWVICTAIGVLVGATVCFFVQITLSQGVFEPNDTLWFWKMFRATGIGTALLGVLLGIAQYGGLLLRPGDKIAFRARYLLWIPGSTIAVVVAALGLFVMGWNAFGRTGPAYTSAPNLTLLAFCVVGWAAYGAMTGVLLWWLVSGERSQGRTQPRGEGYTRAESAGD